MAKKVDIKEGIKPIVGAPTNFGQGTTIRQLDDEGRIVSVKTSGAPLDTYDVKTPQETNNPTRVGDYYFAPDKTLRVWENSPTDILQKYKVAVGGTEAPANTVSIANEGAGAVSGIATGALAGSLGGLPGMAAGALVGGIAGALNAHNTAAEEALKKWQEENVKYDSAVEFYRDDNGALKYKVDYQKMGTGGPRSGEAVKEAQERETKVELGDDGRLKVTVSPIFASTARFKELMDFISENYRGLTKKTENYEGIIKEIKDGIDGEAKSFVTNMRLYADYANSFPNATPESIVSAYMTEAAGYVDPTKMSDFQMTIINENGEKETKTAEEFFNSVYDMSNDDKNRLLERLNTIVYGENSKADDNIKAIASGELKALYAVSRNPEEYKENKYQNMLNADFFVTLVSNFAPLGLNAGDVLNFVSSGNWVQTKQEFLNQDEMAQFIGSSAGVAAGFGLWKGGTALIEKGLKMLPGTSQLFNASLEGKSGGALANILKASESLGVGGSKASTSVATAATASAAFKTLKVGVFDAALAGTKTLVSDADFWSEFGQDFARDAILEAVFSYYDMIQFEKTVDDSVVWMYKDKSGNAKILPTYQERVFVSEDGLDTSTAVEYRPVGAMNIQKTRAGEDVGVIKSNLGTTYYYNGNSITVTPNGEVQKLLTGPNVTTDGMPVLKTGIVEVSGSSSAPKTEISEVKKALEKNGLPANTEVFKASATSASAAQVAAKIAKVDSSKAGLKINTELFNKNAALDTINEIALSKTADLTAWQNRSQKFVSISDNANQEKNLIANGEYIESSAKAFEDYNKTLAELNITKRYSKIDANYLKAKVQLQRAAYLDRHKVEGDTRDYTAEALTKYGEAITRVPEDRAIALDNFLTKRIARHDATKLAAKKSGKIDVKKLDSYMESDLQKEIGWVPQWKKQETYNGILDKFYGISQERNIYKTWLPEGGWVDLDKLEDPIKADDRFLNFVATNMGINDMKESTSMALDDARMLVDNTPSSATVRKEKLDSIKNKDELTKKFSDMIAEKKKEIKERVPSQKQYKEMMQKAIEESEVLDTVDKMINPKPMERTLYKGFDLSLKNGIAEGIPYEIFLAMDSRFSGRAPSGYNSTAEYYNKEKGTEAHLVEMSPDDYLNELVGPQKPYEEEFEIASRTNMDRVGEYADAMEKGDKFPIPYIKYSADGSIDGQEGIHRAFAAKLAKIKKIPVAVEYPVGTRNINNWDEITTKVLGAADTSIDDISESSEKLLNTVDKYNKIFGYEFDVTSYMNTEFLPNLKEAINKKDMGMASTIVNQAVLDIAPYRSQSSLLKSAQESVAEEWREWAEKHIKAGRASSKELKKFAEDNDLKLPNDKRPLPNKIKHALWELLESGKKLPRIEGLDTSKISKSSLEKDSSRVLSMTDKKYKQLLKKAKDYKTLDRFEKMNNPIKGSEVWGEKPTSTFQRDSRAIRVNMFPNDAVKGTGITKQYLLNLFKDAYEQGVTDIFPSYGSYTKEGMSFMDHLAEQGWLNASKGAGGYTSYSVAPKIKEWERTNPLADIYNEAHNKAAASSDSAKENFYKALDETPLFQSATKDKKELVDLVAAEINGTATDAYEMGAAATAVGMNGRYPITWYKNGRPYTRFITYRNAEEQRLAEAVTELFTDKQLIKQPGVISRVASALANDFRLLTTGWDPTRISSNLSRDIGRGQVTSGGQSFIEPGKIFNSLLEFGNYSTAEKQKLSKALDNVSKMIAGETYNAAYRNNKKAITQITKQYLSENGANPLRRFTYSLLHDPTSILEAPADFFEGITRKRLAKSAAVVKLRQLQKDGATVDEQIKGMTDAAFFAGREYTANFQRKGRVIAQTSKYVAYQSSAYAGLNSLKLAFINNPEAVTKNFAVFLILYLILLSDTLGDEDSRKNYYRLSDYDRGNSIIISLDDNTVLTLPLDQEIAGLLFPYRRFLETLNGVDPVSFFEFVWGTLTEPLPMDLSGFSEGEGFNLKRGVEKLASQNMPNVLSGIQEAATGYDLYYGTDLEVTKEDLKNYGIYAPEPGDYTTTGKNSATLRQVANATGIPQWQLQIMVSNYGGNVGSYLLNILDKMQGATRDAQGGKDFADSIFRSFVATDQDAAKNAFYDGIEQLQEEKGKLVQKIVSYNEDIKTASGEAKVNLQLKLQKAKDEFAIKVADFVDKYVSAYEITGGLPKSQAMQIYYLFRLDDDYTVYEEGSPEQYYKTQAEQKFKNQATAMSAPILDKYYNNRIGNIYQDADGNWRQYLSAGVQAMRNSIYGQGEKHMVNLLNILEGKDSNMVSLRRQVKEARSKAFEKRDFTTRDKIGYEFDKKVINAISPYIERYGAKNVLGNSDVLDYLSDWFFVPDKFKRTKRGRYVSLAHNAQTEEAFVRPYIKYVFGLPTNYYSYSDTSLTSPSLGDLRR